MLLIAGSDLLRHNQQATPRSTQPPLGVAHTGRSTWYVINTTGLWQPGGTAPSNAFIQIDGANVDAVYTQPTPAAPITDPAWLLPAGVHVISLTDGVTVYYQTTIDTEWVGTWGGRVGESSTNGNANDIFFLGTRPNDLTQPRASNGYNSGPAYQNPGGINNGYARVLETDETGTLIVCVAPGDQGWVAQFTVSAAGNTATISQTPTTWTSSMVGLQVAIFGAGTSGPNGDYGIYTIQSVTDGSHLVVDRNVPAVTNQAMTYLTYAAGAPKGAGSTNDTRMEPNYTDNYALGANKVTGSPASGINLLGNEDWAVRFYRIAWEWPTSYTFPLTVQNASNTGWQAYQASQQNANRGKWPNGNINPATRDTSASAQVVNDVTNITNNQSNAQEWQGPAPSVVARGHGSGNYSGFTLQPITNNVGLVNVFADVRSIVLDPGDHSARSDLLVEMKPGYFATGNGVPWLVPPGTLRPGSANAWSNTLTVAPYGTPTQGDNVTANPPYGGAYVRVFRWFASVAVNGNTYTNCWSCVTANLPNAQSIAGNTPVYDANWNVLNVADGPFAADAGKIFTPTVKNAGGLLASGPDGTSPALASATNAPFDLVMTSVNGSPRSLGGPILVDNELMFASSWSGSTAHITARGTDSFTLNGVTRALTTLNPGNARANHSANAVFLINIDQLVISFGTNFTPPTVPAVLREWKMRVSATAPTIAKAPASNYP